MGQQQCNKITFKGTFCIGSHSCTFKMIPFLKRDSFDLFQLHPSFYISGGDIEKTEKPQTACLERIMNAKVYHCASQSLNRINSSIKAAASVIRVKNKTSESHTPIPPPPFLTRRNLATSSALTRPPWRSK